MIVDLSFKERAVLFAKLSDIAYLEKADAKKKTENITNCFVRICSAPKGDPQYPTSDFVWICTSVLLY